MGIKIQEPHEQSLKSLLHSLVDHYPHINFCSIHGFLRSFFCNILTGIYDCFFVLNFDWSLLPIVVVFIQLCAGRSALFCPSQALLRKPKSTQMGAKGKGMGGKISCQATSIPADRVPDMEKRKTMNLLLLGAIGLPTATMLYPYTYFFVPPG